MPFQRSGFLSSLHYPYYWLRLRVNPLAVVEQEQKSVPWAFLLVHFLERYWWYIFSEVSSGLEHPSKELLPVHGPEPHLMEEDGSGGWGRVACNTHIRETSLSTLVPPNIHSLLRRNWCLKTMQDAIEGSSVLKKIQLRLGERLPAAHTASWDCTALFSCWN